MGLGSKHIYTYMQPLSENAQVIIDTGRSRMWVVRGYSADFLPYLTRLPLEHEPPSRMGLQRRDIGFFSNESIGYEYSGQIMRSQPLETCAYGSLTTMLTHVNKYLGTNFNGILVNRYIDGSKNIGAHSDDERGLDKQSRMVAGISYGATRKFRITRKSDDTKVVDYMWESGTLLVMDGDFQSEFKHSIPKEMRVKEERISVTFRAHTR